jgi:glycosyltransferase involved in cell wall biosynthesis
VHQTANQPEPPLPERDLKILFLNPGAELGGAERALIEMVASLRGLYSRCQIVAILGDRGALAEKLQALQALVRVIPFPDSLARLGDAAAGDLAGTSASWWVALRLAGAAPGAVAYLRQLSEVIGRIAPDVIHSNGFKMHLLGAWAAPRPARVIWHLHDFVSLRPMMPRLLKLALHRCTGIIANSHCVKRDLAATLDRLPSVHTVYHAVDLNGFTPEGPRLDLDELAGMRPATEGMLRVGIVATTARWKGHEVFLRALAMLPAARIRGYIIGGPIYRTEGSQYSISELQRMAYELGLGERVGFTGFVNDSAAAIRALDIVVHASVAPEPFGLSVAEAFACGRAVIASRGGGVLEIIRENENALAHQPGEANELAGLLMRLVDDPTLRLTLGKAARKTAETRFTRQRLAADLMRVYQAVAVSNSRSVARDALQSA